jgi:hypothetical protein
MVDADGRREIGRVSTGPCSVRDHLKVRRRTAPTGAAGRCHSASPFRRPGAGPRQPTTRLTISALTPVPTVSGGLFRQIRTLSRSPGGVTNGDLSVRSFGASASGSSFLVRRPIQLGFSAGRRGWPSRPAWERPAGSRAGELADEVIPVDPGRRPDRDDQRRALGDAPAHRWERRVTRPGPVQLGDVDLGPADVQGHVGQPARPVVGPWPGIGAPTDRRPARPGVPGRQGPEGAAGPVAGSWPAWGSAGRRGRR